MMTDPRENPTYNYWIEEVTRLRLGPFVSDLQLEETQMIATVTMALAEIARDRASLVAVARCPEDQAIEVELELGSLRECCRRLPCPPERGWLASMTTASPDVLLIVGPLGDAATLARAVRPLWTWQSGRLILLPWEAERTDTDYIALAERLEESRDIPADLVAQEGLIGLEFHDQNFLELAASGVPAGVVVRALEEQVYCSVAPATEDIF